MEMLFDFFVENSWVIPMLPLWAALLIMFGINLNIFESKKISAIITTTSTAIGLIFSIFILLKCITTNDYNYEYNTYWLVASDIKFSLGIFIDNLAAMMLVVVTSISLLIQVYSHEYMKEDKGYHKFFCYLNLFNFSMLFLVLSSNLFEMYIFWELVGLCSYLLIGFWFTRPSAAKAATKAFLMNRIGDFGFLAGLAALLAYSLNFWKLSNDVYLGFSALGTAAQIALDNSGPVIFALIAFGIFLGTVAKSAQIPLHTWLPDAMEGPTPISALIHAATMVAAGVFLIARAYPIFELSPVVMTIIAWVGAITALVAATIAVVQNDIKKALAYSTCSQLGFMVMAMGVGAYSAGLFHLMTHAYFKAMLFLCSGAIIHALADQQDMRFMGGLRRHLPVVAYTYLIGVFAISGLLLSGFWSKEEIFSGLLNTHNYALLAVAGIAAFLTSFYMFRTYFMTFEGEYKGKAHIHKPSKVMTIPLIILAVPSVTIGFMLSGKFPGIESFSNFIFYINVSHSAEHHSLILPIASLFIAFAGAGLAAMLYWGKLKLGVSGDAFLQKVRPLYSICVNKWYFDNIYEWFIKNVFLRIAALFAIFDKYIIDGIVNLMGYITILKSKLIRFFQNGNVQTYATITIGGFACLSFVIIFAWFFLAFNGVIR